MIDGDELERSYKHHLSDYAEWEQRTAAVHLRGSA